MSPTMMKPEKSTSLIKHNENKTLNIKASIINMIFGYVSGFTFGSYLIVFLDNQTVKHI